MMPGDGCTNCQVEPGWTCPNNICQRIPIYPPIIPEGSGLTMLGQVNYNSINLNIILLTPKPYPGLSDYEKKNFIKYAFPDRSTEPTSVYCNQHRVSLDRFECLINYPYGLPNKTFNINFSYSYQSDTGFLSVPANPLSNRSTSRSLGGRSRGFSYMNLLLLHFYINYSRIITYK